MIVCQCSVISDRDIERAVYGIMAAPNAPVPTPGVVFRYLNKRMNCCTCAPLAVATIYGAMDRLAASTRVCPFLLADTRARLVQFEERRERRQRQIDNAIASRRRGRRAQAAA